MNSLRYRSEELAKNFCQSALWKRWRKSVAILLEGPPRLQFYQGVFDSRPELRAYSAFVHPSPPVEVSEQKLEVITANLSTLTPTSMVSHVRESMTKRNASHSTEVLQIADVIKRPLDGTAVVQRDGRLEPFVDYLRERLG